MGSKFSTISYRQKPPGVCHASPPPPPPWEPPFEDQPFQGYVIYNAPHATPEGWLSGSMIVYPAPPTPTWLGSLVGAIFAISAELTWHPSDQTLSYELTVTANGLPHDNVTAPHRRPRSLDRFNSGEITFEPPPFQGRIACHFWW